MAKIIIYEDDQEDLIARYGRLNENHEVHVRAPNEHGWDFKEWPGEDYMHLVKAGFREENFRFNYGDPGSENADVYFVDGLDGDWYKIIQQLPRDKTFLYSGDLGIRLRAKEMGVTLVTLATGPLSLEDIIDQVVARSKEQRE